MEKITFFTIYGAAQYGGVEQTWLHALLWRNVSVTNFPKLLIFLYQLQVDE